MENIIIFLEEYYLWIKAFHVIAVIAWMAGLFYLPRLFVYHVETVHDETKKTLSIMERKLYKLIMQPSMHLSLLLGGFLSMLPGTWSSPWIHLKLLAVIFLVGFHFLLNFWRKALEQKICTKSGRFFRIMNEVPTFLLIVIVIAVVVKPL